MRAISHQTLYRQDNKISGCGNPFSFGVSAQFFPSLENLLRQMRSLTAQSCVQETIRELRQELKSRANSALTPLWPCHLISVPGSVFSPFSTHSPLILVSDTKPQILRGLCLFRFTQAEPPVNFRGVHSLLLGRLRLRALPGRGRCTRAGHRPPLSQTGPQLDGHFLSLSTGQEKSESRAALGKWGCKVISFQIIKRQAEELNQCCQFLCTAVRETVSGERRTNSNLRSGKESGLLCWWGGGFVKYLYSHLLRSQLWLSLTEQLSVFSATSFLP